MNLYFSPSVGVTTAGALLPMKLIFMKSSFILLNASNRYLLLNAISISLPSKEQATFSLIEPKSELLLILTFPLEIESFR